MTVIAEKDRQTVRDLLARELVDEVELLLFTGGRSPLAAPGGSQHDMPYETSDETRELLEELVGLSDRLRLTTLDLSVDADLSTRFNVTAVPTVIIRRRNGSPDLDAAPASSGSDAAQAPLGDAPRDDPAELGTNVRFLGLPGGYEFSTLLADLVDVSKGQTGLSAETRAVVQAVDQPVHIQVFVTPT